MFRRLALAALFITSWAGCSLKPTPQGESQEAIIGGKDDTTDTSVVLVYAAISSTEAALCSGEVVSPHMVLTAAHCVDPATLGTSSAKFVIYLGDTLANDMEAGDPTNVVQVASTDFDQAFDPNNLPGGHDVGAVITQTAIPRSVLPVNQTALPQSDVGDTLKLVGFGITSGTDTQGTTAGTRRTVNTKISTISTKLLTFGTAKVGTCEGDSGGPAFLSVNGVETIVGITSFGPQGCNGSSTDTLVNEYWTSFIQPHITAAESGSTSTTPDASTKATVDMTTTTTAKDDMATASADLAASSTSSSGADASTSTTPATGIALGAVCQSSAECASGICTLGAQHYCTQSCVQNNPSTCPSSMKCEVVGGAPYCVWPTQSSGCSAAPARSGNSAAGALVGILLLLGVAVFLRFAPRRP